MDTPFAKKSFFDAFSPKQAFIFGCLAALLILGTLGCIGLGAYVFRGGSGAVVGVNAAVNSATDTYVAPTGTTSPTTNTVVSLPAITEVDHIIGSGSITIVTYSDFQCPYCKTFDTNMQKIMTDYAGKVKWVYRSFPLSFHDEAQNAAEAAECAGAQGKFWEYASKLFANQSSLGEEIYNSIATELGLNTNDFASCRSSDKMLTVISNDQNSGSAAGVRGTPSSFLIGKDGVVQQIGGGAVPYATLKSLLDKELAK